MNRYRPASRRIALICKAGKAAKRALLTRMQRNPRERRFLSSALGDGRRREVLFGDNLWEIRPCTVGYLGLMKSDALQEGLHDLRVATASAAAAGGAGGGSGCTTEQGLRGRRCY